MYNYAVESWDSIRSALGQVPLYHAFWRIDRDLGRLRAVATGEIQWQEYEAGAMLASDKIEGLFREIMRCADASCTTPSLSCQEPFAGWRKAVSRAVTVDEAANMSRPDLLSVWGNTIMPCVLSGDDKQLPPAVMTIKEFDAERNFLNRFGEDGGISPLAYLKTSGWPVYRLRTQLRMARGLFDLCHQEVYADVPFTYGPGSDISLPQHESGRVLEAFFGRTFPGVLRPSPAGTLQPIFVHCPGSRCIVDQVTGSKQSVDQVKIALDMARAGPDDQGPGYLRCRLLDPGPNSPETRAFETTPPQTA
ncbi:hypothetical protein G6O67_001035 [Ophiocordyceps sinensis]|uniref:Uncharacterized protein n=1 Tax=Ophiocordyceps sinensis TaxID=72228 RepID=A0A8H4PWM7_9HYPO|nr:hypothetical protein G6O67_001035 [Ophiocordyceps sinensis]